MCDRHSFDISYHATLGHKHKIWDPCIPLLQPVTGQPGPRRPALVNPHPAHTSNPGRFTTDTVDNPHPTITYLSSLPILAVVYRFFYLPTANLPIYHNLPISTDFFADLPNFNFSNVNYALTNVIFMYLW